MGISVTVAVGVNVGVPVLVGVAVTVPVGVAVLVAVGGKGVRVAVVSALKPGTLPEHAARRNINKPEMNTNFNRDKVIPFSVRMCPQILARKKNAESYKVESNSRLHPHFSLPPAGLAGFGLIDTPCSLLDERLQSTQITEAGLLTISPTGVATFCN